MRPRRAPLALLFVACATPAQEPAVTSPHAVEAPRLSPTTPACDLALLGAATARLGRDGVEVTNASGKTTTVSLGRPSALTAVGGRFVAAADEGGRKLVLLDKDGGERLRFALPEAGSPLRLLPGADGVWVVLADRAVHQPFAETVPGVRVSSARVKIDGKAQRSAAALPDGDLVFVQGSQLKRVGPDGKERAWPLPEGLSGPVRLAAAGEDELWAAPWTGAVRKLSLGSTVSVRASLDAGGAVWDLAAAGDRVAWLAASEDARGGLPKWTLRVADAGGVRRTEVVEAGRDGASLALTTDRVAVSAGGHLQSWSLR